MEYGNEQSDYRFDCVERRAQLVSHRWEELGSQSLSLLLKGFDLCNISTDGNEWLSLWSFDDDSSLNLEVSLVNSALEDFCLLVFIAE